MTRPRPKAARDETAFTIFFGPTESRTGPLNVLLFVFLVCNGILGVFEGLVRILLVVGGEFEGEGDEESGGEEIVRGAESAVGQRLVQDRGGREAEKEEENILNDSNKSKVEYFEGPNGDVAADDSPAVILIGQAEQATAPRIVGQSAHPTNLENKHQERSGSNAASLDIPRCGIEKRIEREVAGVYDGKESPYAVYLRHISGDFASKPSPEGVEDDELDGSDKLCGETVIHF